MSVIVLTTIRCDAEGCRAEITRTKDGLLIRCIASERFDWMCEAEGDFCPEHAHLLEQKP